jgi:hypothetical protein
MLINFACGSRKGDSQQHRRVVHFSATDIEILGHVLEVQPVGCAQSLETGWRTVSSLYPAVMPGFWAILSTPTARLTQIWPVCVWLEMVVTTVGPLERRRLIVCKGVVSGYTRYYGHSSGFARRVRTGSTVPT